MEQDNLDKHQLQRLALKRRDAIIGYFKIMALVSIGYVSAVYLHLVVPSDGTDIPPECVSTYNYLESSKVKILQLDRERQFCYESLIKIEQELDNLQCSEGP